MVLTSFFFHELHVMQMILMGTDLANTIMDKRLLTKAKVYFALKTIAPIF